MSTTQSNGMIQFPANQVGYVAILMAIITGVIHLLLGSTIIGFSQQMGILFLLNGLGFLGGTAIYLTSYWRPKLYIIAALYAIATIVGLFVLSPSPDGIAVSIEFIDAFYRQGELNVMAVVSKLAEAILAVAAIYLYQDTTA